MLCLQIDILHPLTTLEWEKCGQVPGKSIAGVRSVLGGSTKCVAFGDKVYIYEYTRLYVSNDLNTWTLLPELPDPYGTLTTYRSQLVLVGGIERTGTAFNPTTATNKLWTLSEAGVHEWQESLPPMPTKRCRPAVVSATDPECLIVIGGYVGYHAFEAGPRTLSLVGHNWTQKEVLSVEVLIGTSGLLLNAHVGVLWMEAWFTTGCYMSMEEIST